MENVHRETMPHPSVRPVSWHPSSMGFVQPRPASTYDVSNRHSLVGYQTVDVNGMPTPMTYPDSNSEVFTDNMFSLDAAATPYQSGVGYCYGSGYDPTDLRLNTAFQNGISMDGHSQMTNMTASGNYNSASSGAFSTQTWAESLSYTAPPTPDLLPIQNTSDLWQNEDAKLPPLPRKDSKELVGMGLYDSPERSSIPMDTISDDNSTIYMSERHGSTGKGLKLEETWEPPEEDEGSDDEDAEDDEIDEAAEQREEEEKVAEKAARQAEQVTVVECEAAAETLRQMYGDMSNQSFFFDAEDAYVEGRGMHPQMVSMDSTVRGVTLNNFMWR